MEKPIRILQWGMHENVGGVETFLFQLYKNMDKTKVQFDFLTEHNTGIAYEKEILEMGGKVYKVTYSKKESLIKSYTKLDAFFSEHQEISGIHMHSCFINYSLPLRLAKKHQIPIRIFHSHNSDDMYPTKSWVRKAYRELEQRRIISNATDLFACSDQAGQYMFGNHAFTWIKNGIDADRFQFHEEVRRAKRKELHITEDATVIGFVGRLQYQKNPLFLIDIFYEYHRLNPDALLMIVGDGDLKEQVVEKIKSLGIENQVMLLENRADVNELYQVMDLFLLPSRFEGLAIVLLEAQASGIPCLVSDTIPRQAAVTDLLYYKNIHESASQWAKEIQTMLSIKPDRIYPGEKVKETFNIKSIARELADYYIKHAKKQE